MQKFVTLKLRRGKSIPCHKLLSVMRLSCLLLFLNIGMALANNTYAQNTMITLNVKNNNMASILEILEKQTDFSFVYDANVVNTNWRTSIQVENKNIFDVLNQLFEGTDIAFTVVNKKIVLGTKKNEMIAQQRGKTVTGIITDTHGEPIIGANVIVKGTTNGSISDLDGKVVLNDVPDNAVLHVSYIGYTSQEVKVGNQNVINVMLAEDTQALSEVVVIGYGSLEKKQVTSAITSLKAEDMMVGVSGADVTAALQGKIGGLVMNNLGSANASTTIQLRGMTSINAGK